jgi:hypothetical protein
VSFVGGQSLLFEPNWAWRVVYLLSCSFEDRVLSFRLRKSFKFCQTTELSYDEPRRVCLHSEEIVVILSFVELLHFVWNFMRNLELCQITGPLRVQDPQGLQDRPGEKPGRLPEVNDHQVCFPNFIRCIQVFKDFRISGSGVLVSGAWLPALTQW